MRAGYRAVPFVEDIGDRDTGCLGPMDRLKVVVHGVGDAAHRVRDEGHDVVVEGITPI